MNKSEIIETLNKYNFDKNEYIILSTASLVLQNIKNEAHDIDLAVSEKLLKKLKEEYKLTEKEEGVYTFDKFDLGLNYFNVNKIISEGYPVQTISEVIKLKKKLNRKKDIDDLRIINNYLNKNVLVLAYLGDSVYEVYIRKYLIDKYSNVKELQNESIKYVSAKAQSNFLERMIDNNFLSDEELSIIKRARNHKSHSSKSTDIVTYKKATGLEALIGYLELVNDKKRINEIMNFIVGD